MIFGGNMNDNMFICTHEHCTGCGTCQLICSHGAISMVTDERGFSYPDIDKQLCIECMACLSVCHNNVNQSQRSEIKSVYAAWNRKSSIRKRSSSGGVFLLIAKEVIHNGGYVFGVKWDENMTAIHSCTDTLNELAAFCGSKYVQSKLGTTFFEIRDLLIVGKQVLFSGTPCQCAALRAFLKNDYDNLLIIDLICHGVPSPKLFEDYKKILLKDRPNDRIKNISFRYKKPGWSFHSIKVDYLNSKAEIYNCYDTYYTLFVQNYIQRDSCYHCQYTTAERLGDITLADFWNYSPQRLRMRDFDKGVSCIMVNTVKGAAVFEKIKKDLNYETKTIDDAFTANPHLKQPLKQPLKQTFFWNDYLSGIPINVLYEKYCERVNPPEHYYRHIFIQKYKSILPSNIKNILRKLLRKGYLNA